MYLAYFIETINLFNKPAYWNESKALQLYWPCHKVTSNQQKLHQIDKVTNLTIPDECNSDIQSWHVTAVLPMRQPARLSAAADTCRCLLNDLVYTSQLSTSQYYHIAKQERHSQKHFLLYLWRQKIVFAADTANNTGLKLQFHCTMILTMIYQMHWAISNAESCCY